MAMPDGSEIQLIEEEYIHGRGGLEIARIPVIYGGGGPSGYGNPLFRMELLRGPRTTYIHNILLGIPHLERIGYTAWRRIPCRIAALSLGNLTGWNFIHYCKEHKTPIIEFYPPKPLPAFMQIDLETSVMSSLRWVDERGSLISEWGE
jgi:hypothetical protein